MHRNETDYARNTLKVDPERDRHTMRGIYFTVADLKHIRAVLGGTSELSIDDYAQSRAWSQHLLNYIGDPNKAR